MDTSNPRIPTWSQRRGRKPWSRWPATLGAVASGAFAWAAGCTTSGNLDPGRSGLESVSSMVCVKPRSDAVRDLVCSRWACAHAKLSAATWDGDASSCTAGSFDERARKKALALVNAYRFIAGVPEVQLEPRWHDPAQDCALIAHANKQLSHTPPHDWSCWNLRGARASAVSLVANRSAPLAIDAFIEDPGNEKTMVHRRWLLSEKIHRLGLGSTSGYSCALVDGREWDGTPPPSPSEANAASEADAASDEDEEAGETDDGEDREGKIRKRSTAEPPAWVAWPPPGPVPIDAIRRSRVDINGWTIQSSSLDLDGAKVEIRVGGFARPISVRPLERTMGSLTAVRIVPKEWSTEPDEHYDVHLEKDDTVIDFTVQPVMCP